MVGTETMVPLSIFLVVYGLIISEKVHRAVVAVGGAVLVVMLGVLSQKEAIASIDFNTIGLLVGMMMIVGITRRSGVFEYIAIKAAKVAQGNPYRIMAMLSVITAVLSAFLDNVTTVLLIVPVTFSVTDRLKINPLPFLFAEIISSNIGGTATLIGDPPNIMIGSAVGLGFMDFVVALGPAIVIILAVTVAIMLLVYRGSLKVSEEDRKKVMELDEFSAIKDRALLRKSLAVLVLTVTGFFLHQTLHLESATIALGGAALLMLLTAEEPEDILLTVEWPTIFFFAGLFIVVEGLVKVGIIEYIARESLKVTQGDLTVTAVLVLWLAGIASSIVDNIPFVATMIPLLESVGRLSGMPMEPLWWSLALGACLGGNGTLIGASANVVVAGLSNKYGREITFIDYLKVGFPLMVVSLLISTLYIKIRYLA